ncbi:50S ribosomal protein L11 methyltransferase [Myxacorys almedinensis]|uniref:Methyltransferase n=1 Tax=Myxacorys almedinensis A TaxID=2690445 RepID=A0A8J8CNA7_9CYAN|nr:50S ribosomal protein L11 methyltransferase [Myxacorys almedinensis]NDJ19400.1 methyltransferase [Myxacorys almedinensis A]
MSWIEISLSTTREAVDWVRTLLAEDRYTDDLRVVPYCESGRGSDDAPSNELENSGLESAAIATKPWAFTIAFYLPDEIHTRAQVEKIRQLLSSLHRTGDTTALEVAIVDEKPPLTPPPLHRVGRFVILAADADYEAQNDERLLRLGTSFSFGSGWHPATILSLRLIERYVTPAMKVLDLGCGSGILSVAIARLQAQVLALDNDATAVQATQDAVQRNGVAAQVTVSQGSLGRGSQLGHWMGGTTLDTVPAIAPSACFDLIVANIFARVHIALAEDYGRSLRQTDASTGLLITSGFTTDYEPEVISALGKAGFQVIERDCLEHWVALSFAKRLS